LSLLLALPIALTCRLSFASPEHLLFGGLLFLAASAILALSSLFLAFYPFT
jgi:hypothetical protein